MSSSGDLLAKAISRPPLYINSSIKDRTTSGLFISITWFNAFLYWNFFKRFS